MVGPAITVVPDKSTDTWIVLVMGRWYLRTAYAGDQRDEEILDGAYSSALSAECAAESASA